MDVLVVEEDAGLRRMLERLLRNAAYSVDVADSAQGALAASAAKAYRLVILDRNLPGRDGLSLVDEFRRCRAGCRILMLGGHAAVADAVEAGADECLSKPLNPMALLARVGAFLRRGNTADLVTLRNGPIALDERSVAFVGTSRLVLSVREFELLRYFVQNVGRDLSREEILRDVWGMLHDPQTNLVDVYVHRLRGKLGRAASLLVALRGFGYRMEAAAAAKAGLRRTESGVALRSSATSRAAPSEERRLLGSVKACEPPADQKARIWAALQEMLHAEAEPAVAPNHAQGGDSRRREDQGR